MGTPRKDLRLLRGDSLTHIDEGDVNDEAEAPVKALSKTSSLLALSNHDLYIPKDIIFHIFTFTGRNQLAICSRVCKLWKLLASDSYFGWEEITTILVQDPVNYEAQGQIGKEAEYQYIGAKQFTIDFTTSQYSPIFEFVVDGKKIGNLRAANSTYHLRLDELQKAIQEYPRLWRCDVYSRKHTKITPPDYVDYELRFEINIKEFEKMEVERKETPCAHLIYTQVRNERHRKLYSNTFRTANIPRTVTKHSFKQPEGFKEGINLYKYQLNAVAWMKSLEDNKYEKIPYCYLTPWRKAQSNRLFDLVHTPNGVFGQPFIHPTKSLTDVPTHLVDYMSCGGVIADEMGLGKTMEMLGLILANRKTTKSAKSTKKKNKKNQTELFDGPTLVLCPSHLVHQWVEEITSKTTNMKYIVMTTINQVKAVTYGDVLDADVVIASYQLLRNPSYFFGATGSGKQKTNISKQDVRMRPERIEAELWFLLKKPDPLAESKPVLDHFNWQRIILDEGHEVLLHKDYQVSLEQFKFKFKWIVSGTPFPNTNIMGFIANQFIKMTANQSLFSETKREILLDHLYWKNTKDSVKDEYKIPPLVEELVLLNFTDVEQIAYDHSNAYVKSELCCQHGGMQLMTLTEYRGFVIDQHKLLLDQNEKSLPTLRAHYEQNKRTAERAPTTHNTYMLQTSKRELEDTEAQIANSTKCIKLMGELKAYDGPHSENMNFAGYSDSDEEDKKVKEVGKKKKSSQQKKEKEVANKEKEDEKEEDKVENSKKDNEKKKKKKEPEKEEKEVNVDAMDTADEERNDMKDGANPTEKEEKKNEEKKEEKEEKQEEEQKEKYTQEEVDKMTVAQLTRILTKAKIEIPKKSLKAALQALVISNGVEKEVKKQTAKKKKEEKEKKTEEEKKDTGKRKKEEESEAEETEAAEEEKGNGKGKRKATSKSAAPPAKRTKGKKKKEEDEEPRWPLTKEEQEIEAQNLKFLIETSGTKLANLTIYLQRLWRQDPKARVIIFSQFSQFLTNIGQMLARNDIPSAFVEGNVMRREKALKSFKAQTSEIKVILISLSSAASGSNLIQATHIILMDPVQGTKKEALATESQAIGRAHRQGQNNTVTLVRFIIKNTIEYDTYVKNYLSDEHIIVKGEDPSKQQLVHSDNIDDLIDSQLPGRKSAFIDNLTTK